MVVCLVCNDDLDDCLAESKYVDYTDGSIQKLAHALMEQTHGDVWRYSQAAFEYVRDKVMHSWDAQDHRVTVTASQCLNKLTGICYAKSNLLAALLRMQGVPTGFCYQRLTLGETADTGYCIHTLNAVWHDGAWHRIDARGNKPGINAQFNLDHEQLAFTVRPEIDEIDYPTVYAEPMKVCMNTVETSSDAIDMYLHHLPERIPVDLNS
jgi:transglutaminase-like putative cysteine protease